jgi:serine/threonine protein kinase
MRPRGPDRPAVIEAADVARAPCGARAVVLGSSRLETRFPRVVGRYTLLRSLGKGGTGEAFLAAFGEPTRLCVLKMGVEDMDPDTVEKIEAEARVMLRISCPNIVSVLEAGQHEGRWYLAMELVDGRDLREVMRRARARGVEVPVSVALFIVREIVRGLHYLHSSEDLRIIHRDVSPANVMVAFSGEVKLIDFGLARSASIESHTRPGMADGHFGYLAPERMAGRRYDHRADLYSAGLILWELLAGKEWFVWPETSAGIMVGVPPERSAALPLLSSMRAGIAPALEEIVRKSIALDPSDRFADAEAMRVALAEYLGTVDAAADWGRVQAFVRPLFEDEIAASRREREKLSNVPQATVGPGPVPMTPPFDTEELPRWLPGHRKTRGAMLIGGASILTLIAGVVVLHPPGQRPVPSPPPHATSDTPQAHLQVVESPPAARSVNAESVPAAHEGPNVTAPPPVAEGPSSPSGVASPRGEQRIGKRARSARTTLATRDSAVRRTQEPAPGTADHAGEGAAIVRSARQALQNRAYDDAVDLGKQALRAGGDPLGAHLVLAASYYLLTRYPEARQHYEAALKIDPSSREATRGLATTKEQLER